MLLRHVQSLFKYVFTLHAVLLFYTSLSNLSVV